MSSSTDALKPRKRPHQQRARVTVDAIFEATIQVLLIGNTHKLTTTRVAERAGVSIGTMYQYFPNKQSLIYALNERYLEALAVKIEKTCQANHGATVEDMVAALVDTYWVAKMERPDVTRVLYRSVVDIDNEALIANFAERVNAATLTMFSSSRNKTLSNLERINLTLTTVIFGAIRNAFERNFSDSEAEDVREQLVLMCLAYLNAHQKQ
ncbi:TetR/AcrR family transcriptional regulator [Ahrensia kielensis]|uniref:TetR/AcrR family transcriptional regulator n=1 Tax=Ahrensia kielensis TaxID=76980 RepID=UPI0003724239|nr:TetR/AcrR family transcriptional regulator [Ahrensia kielensis]